MNIMDTIFALLLLTTVLAQSNNNTTEKCIALDIESMNNTQDAANMVSLCKCLLEKDIDLDNKCTDVRDLNDANPKLHENLKSFCKNYFWPIQRVITERNTINCPLRTNLEKMLKTETENLLQTKFEEIMDTKIENIVATRQDTGHENGDSKKVVRTCHNNNETDTDEDSDISDVDDDSNCTEITSANDSASSKTSDDLDTSEILLTETELNLVRKYSDDLKPNTSLNIDVDDSNQIFENDSNITNTSSTVSSTIRTVPNDATTETTRKTTSTTATTTTITTTTSTRSTVKPLKTTTKNDKVSYQPSVQKRSQTSNEKQSEDKYTLNSILWAVFLSFVAGIILVYALKALIKFYQSKSYVLPPEQDE